MNTNFQEPAEMKHSNTLGLRTDNECVHIWLNGMYKSFLNTSLHVQIYFLSFQIYEHLRMEIIRGHKLSKD